MDGELAREIERLTVNAASRRYELQRTGLRNANRRRQLTIAAGLLALTSAGAITTVISNVFGNTGVQILAAITALVSGGVSLFISAYYTDDAISNMLLGSSKYLALRENVYRLVIHPKMSDAERFRRLGEFQTEYALLDEAFSKYFNSYPPPGHHGRTYYGQQAPPPASRQRPAEAIQAELDEQERVRAELKRAIDSE